MTLTARGESKNTVRDNVLFELGLFIGRLSRSRTFIVKPRGVQLDLPSDLYGITTIDYEQDRSDANLTASLGPAARKIIQAIRLLAPRTRASDVALPEAGEDETQSETSSSANDRGLFTLDALSEWSDYNFAFFMAVIHSDEKKQQEVDKAFRESAFGESPEYLAAWEASGALNRMIAGQPASLQFIRDKVTSFPKSSRLLRILGDALEHYGDTEGALKSYAESIKQAETIESAAAVVPRMLLADAKAPCVDLRALRSQLLTLPQTRPQAEALLGAAMRNLAESSNLKQIPQGIDEVNIGNSPDDSGLKFNLAFSYGEKDADLSMLHYESIPASERTGTGWNNLGVAYSNLQMPGSAVAAYEVASQKGETIADGNLANKLLHAGFFTMARERAQQAVAIPSHNNNVVIALGAIGDAQAEEEKKLAAAKASAKRKQRFIRQLGYAALKPEQADILGAWQTPEGILEIIAQDGGGYLAFGEFTREETANQLGLAGLFIRPGPVINKTIISARLQRFGDAFEGTLTRKPSDPSRVGLLGSYAREEPIAIYPLNSDTLCVCITTYERQEVDWKRPISIPTITASAGAVPG